MGRAAAPRRPADRYAMIVPIRRGPGSRACHDLSSQPKSQRLQRPTEPFDYEAAIAGCARKDQRALRSLYERDGPYLLGVALRIVRDRQAAEDVLHDAFVSVWAKASGFDPALGAGRGWLFSIVRHQALNVVRARMREVYPEEEAMAALEDANAYAAAGGRSTPQETHVTLGRLGACLETLDGPKRESILYAYLEGCSHGEIAARMGSPLGTVKAWIRRGLDALRECMQ